MSINIFIMDGETLEILTVKGYQFLVASNLEFAVEVAKVIIDARRISQQFN
jgi:hypothetical protein